MLFNKVVIPCAGTGSRLRTFTKSINKALVTINNRPAISYVIDQFPKSTTFVIVLGYKGDQVRSVIEAIYPNRNFIFETVDKYEGEGSGLSVSLKAAEKHLQEPFCFISNDTILLNDTFEMLDSSTNFVVGADRYKHADLNINDYRTVQRSESGAAVAINRKGVSSPSIYIGFAGIVDYDVFWEGMKSADDTVGESAGITHMMNKRLYFKYFNSNWYDTGSLKGLSTLRGQFSQEFNILEKDGESIWFYENRVIKFSVDKSFISNRVNRSKAMSLGKISFPTITHYNDYTYQYNFIDGETVSSAIDEGTFSLKHFSTLLDYMTSIELSTVENPRKIDLYPFYKDKTIGRLKQYYKRFELNDSYEMINGKEYTTVLNRLEDGEFDSLFDRLNESVVLTDKYHGDFHFENILTNGKEFTLIDWRQSFINVDGKDFGDLNYDYAKLLHGLYVSHLQVHLGNYHVRRDDSNAIIFDIDTSFLYGKMIDMLRSHLGESRFKRIKFLTGIVFLNIAALHDPFEYCQLLYYLGKTIVLDSLGKV